MKEFESLPINLVNGNSQDKRIKILKYFEKTFETEEKLYSVLSKESTFYLRADSLRHPLIFYYGHTACFFVNKLINAKIITQRINPIFESIFAIGVDEMSWDDLNENNYDWPTVSETLDYRSKVKALVRKLILEMNLELPIDWQSNFHVILMGIEHQRIHIETSSVLIRQLPIDEVNGNNFGKLCTLKTEPKQNELISVEAFEISLGKARNHRFYGWDLEYGEKYEKVDSFNASKFLVSNKEFLEFVEDNGYSKDNFWSDEGINWKNYTQQKYPLFWIKTGHGWNLRLMSEIIEMPWSFPVEVNYLEAKAFCNWKTSRTGLKLRLPTEAEWYALVKKCKIEDVDLREKKTANINLEHFASPCPVNLNKFGDFYDVIGNVWQWTDSELTAFPGFKVHKLYDDFSVPTFDTKHNLIKGGSWISTGNEATLHARYAFRRHFYQHAGFRYIESELIPKTNFTGYETEKEICMACEQSFGNEYFGISNYKKKLSEIVLEYTLPDSRINFLDLNSGCGRTSLELSGYFENLTAIDFTTRFIKPVVDLIHNGFLRYTLEDEGEILEYKEITLNEFGFSKSIEKVNFLQADAENLKPIFTGYDTILCANLIESLKNPQKFLKEIHNRINHSGRLILSSTYFGNHKINQIRLGGYKKDGESVYSFDTISEILSKKFKMICKPFDIESVSKLNSRKFIIELNQVSVWERI